MKRILTWYLVLTGFLAQAQTDNFTSIRTTVDFDWKLREWDGFGFNYVETAQTTDYEKAPQEYGGFSLLDEKEKAEIIDMVFGEDGLKVGLVKMFYDPWHQTKVGGEFNHERTTQNMREFVRKGLAVTRARGADLEMITTLYGPPPFITKQKFLRGRDLDPTMKDALAEYFISWADFLVNKEKFPLKYVSLHNEGEDWWRWPADGKDRGWVGHDYNMYWSPELVTEFIPFLKNKFNESGLTSIGVTNGEPSNWFRFSSWGYADELYKDEIALNHLALVTSHGFYTGGYNNRWFGPHTSEGIDLLRKKRPELKAWVTSTSWSQMDAKNIKEMHGNIYSSKVNGIIPWAGIQRPAQWYEGDPNPGSAFTVKEDGSYEVRRGYYFYKQVSRAGQPGMAVAKTTSMDSQIAVIAFANNKTDHPDAIVVVNWADEPRKVNIEVKGSAYQRFEAYRTTNDESDLYSPIGDFSLENNTLLFDAPAGSVTTFFGK